MDQQKQQLLLHSKSPRILRLPDVESKTGLACSSIYLMVSNNTFPAPIKLSKRSVGWLENEIDQWIEDRINQTRNTGGKQ